MGDYRGMIFARDRPACSLTKSFRRTRECHTGEHRTCASPLKPRPAKHRPTRDEQSFAEVDTSDRFDIYPAP